MSRADDTATAVATIAERVGPGVLNIGRDGGRGAGLILRAGLVVTSAHNLRGSTVTIGFGDGRIATGEVLGMDIEGDLAVIGVETGELSAVPWPPLASGAPALGQEVFAVGSLAGGPRVTAGRVSALGAAFRGPRARLITDAIEHTAVVGRGSSGGPLVDAEGNLVAINTHRPGDGLYLAIPATEAVRRSVEALAAGQAPTGRRLGVALAPPYVARRLRAAVGLEERDGLLVRDVEEGSPAAGRLQKGDLIVGAAGRPVESIDALLAAVDGAAGSLRLTVVRGAAEVDVDIPFPD